MPLLYDQNTNTYSWDRNSQRPAKPQGFSDEMLRRFLETNYAQKTSLAEFLRQHPNAVNNGVLNQLHRRHIISWDMIKNFTASAAAINWVAANGVQKENFEKIFNFFHVNPTNAVSAAVGVPRANQWQIIANQMCWVDNNVFIGPSAGNVGVDIDQVSEMNDSDRRDLLAGTPWQGADLIYAFMQGFIL